MPADPSRIHSLYQDLYLTDMKQTLGNANENLSQLKKQITDYQDTIKKQQSEIQNLKRTITSYRRQVVELNEAKRPATVMIAQDETLLLTPNHRTEEHNE